MFERLFKPYRKYKNLGDIKWIESQNEKYFEVPIEQLQMQHKQITETAKEAQFRGKMAGEIYQGMAAIENAKIDANTQGVRALGTTQAKRSGYRSMRGRLFGSS